MPKPRAAAMYCSEISASVPCSAMNRPGTVIPGLLQVVHGADAGFSRSELRQLMAAAPLIEPLAQSI